MNSVNLFGRTTKDIIIKTTKNGFKKANFTLAVDGYANKEKKTNFFNCVAFEKTAETMERLVGKGSSIAITGELDNFDIGEGNEKKTVYQIVVNRMDFGQLKAPAGVSAGNQAPDYSDGEEKTQQYPD